MSARDGAGRSGNVVGIRGDQAELDLQGGGVPILSRWEFLTLWKPHLRPAGATALNIILKSGGGAKGCFKHVSTLAADAGCGVSTIERGIRELKRCHILPRRRRGKGKTFQIDFTARPEAVNLPRVKVETRRADGGLNLPRVKVGQPSTGEGWHIERHERDTPGSAVDVPRTAKAEAEPGAPPISDSESVSACERARPDSLRAAEPRAPAPDGEGETMPDRAPVQATLPVPPDDGTGADGSLATLSDDELREGRERVAEYLGAADPVVARWDAELARRGLDPLPAEPGPPAPAPAPLPEPVAEPPPGRVKRRATVENYQHVAETIPADLPGMPSAAGPPAKRRREAAG